MSPELVPIPSRNKQRCSIFKVQECALTRMFFNCMFCEISYEIFGKFLFFYVTTFYTAKCYPTENASAMINIRWVLITEKAIFFLEVLVELKVVFQIFKNLNLEINFYSKKLIKYFALYKLALVFIFQKFTVLKIKQI